MAGQGTCATGAAACVAVEQALAFVDGRLIAAERAIVERRIDACTACRAVVAEAARGAGGELIRDPGGRTEVQRARGATRPRVRARIEPMTDPPELDEPAEHTAARPADPGGAGPIADAELVPGEVVGRYVVERPLGAGGMGVVSLARDPELRRAVVIKLVHPNMGHGEGGDELEARLRREAQAMAQVSHSNVVQIFDIGRRGDRVFLAMEFIAGRTFDVWLREQRRTPDEILAMIRQAGAGLAAAHRAGLVHRDFKPTNVLVGDDGVAKVTDFGLARSFTGAAMIAAGATRKLRLPAFEAPPRGDEPTQSAPPPGFDPLAAGPGAPRPSGVHAVLTQADSVVGTPAYMAPEQAAGRAIDARTDQYALAVTLLDALLGQSPVRRAVAPSAPAAALDDALEHAWIAAPVRAAIIRALAEDPAARFATIDELLRSLAPPPPRRSRRTALVLAAIALLGIAAAAWFALRPEPAGCAAAAPGRWAGAPRARVIAALGAAPRPFAGWDAERIAGAIDGAVESIAAAELARCRGAPLAGTPGTALCIAHRSTALDAAVGALSASPLPEDPWAVVRSIEPCDAAASPSAASPRRDLAGAPAARAREIAGTARTSGDDLLAADALEVAGLAALAGGDAATAETDLLAMSAAGERAGNDAARGRALLHLIDVARWRGDHATAKRDVDELHAMLARHGERPRDVLTVALAEADAFTDLGDVATVFAAWDRARDAAGALGDHDAELAIAVGRAWSTCVLRFDPARARIDAVTALRSHDTASAAARSAALAITADIALAGGDGSEALAAITEARRLAPGRDRLWLDRVRIQRARALAGEVDGALAELVPAASDDPVTAARITIARGKLLALAEHVGEARDVLERVEREVRGHDKTPTAMPMAVAERLDLELALCAAQLDAADSCKTGYQLDTLTKGLHPRAPVRATVAILAASSEAARQYDMVRSRHLSTALAILLDAGAESLRIAELRWKIAQLGVAGLDHRGLATAAREVFLASRRTADVAEIDAWLAAHPGAEASPSIDAGVPPADASRSRARVGPEP